MRQYAPDPRAYELMTILSPDVPEDEIPGVLDGISGYVAGVGGTVEEVLRDSPWGRRRLAYPIRHAGRDVRDGYYTVYHVRLEPRRVAEVERDLKLNTRVIRYLLTQYEPKPLDPRAVEDAQVDAEDAAAAAYAAAQASASAGPAAANPATAAAPVAAPSSSPEEAPTQDVPPAPAGGAANDAAGAASPQAATHEAPPAPNVIGGDGMPAEPNRSQPETADAVKGRDRHAGEQTVTVEQGPGGSLEDQAPGARPGAFADADKPAYFADTEPGEGRDEER